MLEEQLNNTPKTGACVSVSTSMCRCVLRVVLRMQASECGTLLGLLTEADEGAGHPQDIGHQRRKDQGAAQDVAVFLLERVHHRDIAILSHWFGEEDTAW